jgi:hypothetical protein
MEKGDIRTCSHWKRRRVCFGYMKVFEKDEQEHSNNMLDLYRKGQKLAPEVEKMNQENRAMSVPRRNA